MPGTLVCLAFYGFVGFAPGKSGPNPYGAAAASPWNSRPACGGLCSVAGKHARIRPDRKQIARADVAASRYHMTVVTSIGHRAEREARDVSLRPIHLVHRRCSYDYKLAFEPVGGVFKRAFDICAAAAALIVLSGPLLLVALIIQLTSPGPALFRQARSGFRGRVFEIYKFRTMSEAPIQGDQVVQTREDDPRVTWFGRFLRRTSIDELPQLLNVLRGDMSLVGPRPHALAHDRVFYGVNTIYPRRFHARPGITGLAQVAGARGRTDTPEKVEARLQLDLEYIETWSFRRDLLILAKTVRLLFSDRNAF